ncbi:MAG: phosphomannomutase [Desulfobulbaceae bacterium]|nr:phosphomannomutase [Desulfobulbaceae bacterium]
MAHDLRCFTAYDIRGRVPDELNQDIARYIAAAFAKRIGLKKVVIGHDMRLTSPLFAETMAETLVNCGVDVVEIGLCGTEEVYHAVFAGEVAGIDGGIMITASHNPADYNGMKLVRRGARPLSGDTGLREMEADVAAMLKAGELMAFEPDRKGTITKQSDKKEFVKHILSYVSKNRLKPLKIVINAGNGCAGPVMDLLEKELPFEFVKIHHQPDGTLPNGIPNPLLPEKREATAQAVRDHGADLGIAWDGDFDRCFLYDETGRFIEGYYIVGLLATALLHGNPGSVIIHDPRLVWNTEEMVEVAGGKPVMTKTGHAFIKERMRAEDAIYGGEMSAHHYFRDFGYCDSGMIPWLLVAGLMSESGDKLSAMVDDRMVKYPVSGEINSTVKDPDEVISRIKAEYGQYEKDYTDGLSVIAPKFRINVRKSNTEPVLRLNVETRADKVLLDKLTGELLDLIRK